MRSDKNFLFLARARVECTDTVYSLSSGLRWFLKGYGLQDLCPTRDIDGASAASQGRNWDRGCGPLFLITVLLGEETKGREEGKWNKMRKSEGECSRVRI